MSKGRIVLGVATLAALALSLRAALGEPPPPGVAVLALLSYLGLVFGLALAPRLETYGPVLAELPAAGAAVALTFDDGPDPASTARVLEQLAARGARATFFVLGARAAAAPELLLRMREAGHTVGVHSWAHDRAFALLPASKVRAELERCQQELERHLGERARWFRPPVGQASPWTFAGARAAGLVLVAWSVRARDGLPGTSERKALERVERGLRPGAIVLLHDAWERPRAAGEPPPAGARALEAILDACARRGLAVVSLDELVARAEAAAGVGGARAA